MVSKEMAALFEEHSNHQLIQALIVIINQLIIL
jgi:hypothetical protein